MHNTHVLLNMTIEGMRQEIMKVLPDYEGEVAQEIQRGVQEALAAPDLAFTIRQQARAAVEKHVQDAVARAIDRAFWQDDLRNALDKLGQDAVRKALLDD